MVDMKREILFTRGLPGSGKTTFADQYIAQSPTTRTCVSHESITRSLFNTTDRDQVDERMVISVESAIIQQLMKAGERDIIVDSSGFDLNRVMVLTRSATQFGYQVKFVDFNVELTELIFRDIVRETPVGEDVLRSQHSRLVEAGQFPTIPLHVFSS
jgi:predicted kinase